MNAIAHSANRGGACRIVLVVFAALLACQAEADEAAVRKGLTERLPGMPVIDEVRPGPIPGIYEVRMGTQIVYADENGRHLIEGAVFDSQTRTDLTRSRIEQLTAFDFKKLPMNDALVIRHGAGQRKVAVFADPQCGHCKRLEAELKGIDNLTVYLFPLAVLGESSLAKARDIWCATDAGQRWQDWMLQGKAAPSADIGCDSSSLTRNLALGEKHRIEGTPTLVFEDSTRASGVLTQSALEQRIANASAPH